MRYLAGLSLVFFLFSGCSGDFESGVRGQQLEGGKVWTRLHTAQVSKLRRALEHEGFDVTGSHHRYEFVDVYGEPGRIEEFMARHTGRIAWTENLDLLSRVDSRYIDAAEMSAFLDSIESSYPDIAMKVTLEDELFEGQVLYAMKISDNVTVDEDEPVYLMDMQMHAREVMTGEVAQDSIDYITSRYGSDPQVDRWVDEMEIWIVPQVNPDGIAYVHDVNDMWRKNRNPVCAVDLNRNYEWSYRQCSGSSDDCYDDTYHGTGPASEPETQAMQALMAELRPMYYINYHSYGEYIIWPGGCGFVDEHDLFLHVGEQLNELVETDDGQTGQWEIGNSPQVLYTCPGGAEDHVYGAAGALGFVFELNSWSFHPDYDQWRDVTVERQRAAWSLLLDLTLDGPSVTGHTFDAATYNPVAATYQFANHPFTSGQWPLETDAQGRFGRAVLPASEHVMVFTAPGYLPETRIVDVDQQPVDLDVPMTQGVNHAPAADAGPDQQVNEGDMVSMDASASSDPDGNTLFYNWILLSGPAIELVDAYSASPGFFAPGVDSDTDLVFEVVASDGELQSAPDSVTVTVRNIWDEVDVFDSSDTPIDIPDDNLTGITSVITVTEDSVVLKASAEVDISHSYIGDLVVTLKSPQGTEVILHDHEGGSANDLHEVYEPAEFTGQMSGGDWILHVRDEAVGDVGTLNWWTLSLELVGDPPCQTAADCDLPNVAVHECVDGRCEIVTCDAGFGDCNELANDGCENDVLSDPLHCGDCWTVCEYANAVALCSNGSCEMGDCLEGFENCNGTTDDGCEADLDSDPSNCGSCQAVCDLPNAQETCVQSECRILRCEELWGNCDSDHANGCETDVSSDLENCGACNRECQLPHAQAVCVQGGCQVASCDEPYDDCDAAGENGCETDLSSHIDHCGSCGNACFFDNAAGQCQSGQCVMGACQQDYGDCNSLDDDGCETYLPGNADHCGSCDNSCDLPHAEARCVQSACQIDSCHEGFGNCNNEVADGCEIDITADPANCGACGMQCYLSHATAGCDAGTCIVAGCETPFGDCNDLAEDGCETFLNDDAENCGECGNSCELEGADSVCRQGECVVTSCDAGLANCDNDHANGCEANLQTDPENCGSCGHECVFDNAVAACQAGECVLDECEDGFADCNNKSGDGCEVDVTSDEDNCGQCGKKCPSGQSCLDGVCEEPCADNDGDGYPAAACGGTDCDDTDADVHPQANETCNGRDDDCDGATDEELECSSGCGCTSNSGKPGQALIFLALAFMAALGRKRGRLT